MARDAAIISTWGDTVPGREGKSLEVFFEYVQWLGKLASEGKITPPEVFFNLDGSEGISVVKGKSDVLLEILESEESEKFFAKGHMIVENLRAHLYITGDEEIQRGTRIFAEAGSEIGLM
jgi:hypothetical protein